MKDQLVIKEVPAERHQFRALLLSNPNYFGNLTQSPLTAVTAMQQNTTYEAIGCVGFQPQFNRLETVVQIRQSGGYGGDLCGNGTQEYLRSYLSYDQGATWVDLGVVSFAVHDIPDTTPAQSLKYAVTLPIQPQQHWCHTDNICQVRTILSWNVTPPANQPDFKPVWGDVHDTHIMIDARNWIIFDDLLTEAKVKLSSTLKHSLDLSQPIAATTAKALSATELHQLYAGAVEPHRFAMVELQQVLHQPTLTDQLLTGQHAFLPNLDVNWEDFIPHFYPVDGNTTYEELECIGLNTDQDTLIGTIRVKKSQGYSGGPCTAGSLEYVAFWADFDDNGSFETYLGTTSVNVHDVNDAKHLPGGGLEFAVFLPVKLDKYRQPCAGGAKRVRIRAVLSWQSAPPSNNPNFIPTWGNRREALVQLKPGAAPYGHAPFMETVGRVQVNHISSATGLANGGGLGFNPVDSPFGGLVFISGHIANPPDQSSGAAPLKYRVSVSPDNGSTWEALNNAFNLERTQLLNGVWSSLPDVTQADLGGGYYAYREDLTGGPSNAQIFVIDNILAHWYTNGLSGKWLIKIEATDGVNTYTGNMVTVQLDNQAPQFPTDGFKITSGAGSCADFKIGDVIEGTYAVTDEHFSGLTLSVEPSTGGTGVFTAPVLPRSYPMVPTSGESGIWKLDTTGMPRCGYVVRLTAADRTIVNSSYVGYSNSTSVGFCLRP